MKSLNLIQKKALAYYWLKKKDEKSKKKFKKRTKTLKRDRKTLGLYQTYIVPLRKCPDEFKNYLRMSVDQFDDIVLLLDTPIKLKFSV